MPETIAVINQKGGVGKTTTAYNLASTLSRYNKRILLIDLDPQGNCSQAIGVDSTILKRTISDLLDGRIELRRAIRKTPFNNISLIPANISLEGTVLKLVQEKRDDVTILKRCLQEKEASYYDFIIIDCPPSLGLLSLNALTASDSLIVPVQCEYFALEALARLLASVNHVQKSSNPDLEIMGILLTMFDPRAKLSVEIASEVRNSCKEKLFTTTIPRNISVSEAIARSMPVVNYKPGSQGALAYMSLAREVMAYVEDEERQDEQIDR